jgi:hypothetical protein
MKIMKQIGSIEQIGMFNVKFENSLAWQVAEMLAEYLNSMQARLSNI